MNKNEVRKIYEATMLQFEKESLWGKVYHYEMRVCFNPYDTEAKRKRIETVNKIKEINEKIDTIRKQLTAPSLRQGTGSASWWKNDRAPTP